MRLLLLFEEWVGGGGWGLGYTYKPCKYILLQSANADVVIFTSYDNIYKVYELFATLKNDNDSNVSVQDYSQHPNNQQQPLLLHPTRENFYRFMANGVKKRNLDIK